MHTKEWMMIITRTMAAGIAAACCTAVIGCTSAPETGWSTRAASLDEDGGRDTGVFGEGTGPVAQDEEIPLDALTPEQRGQALRATAIDLLMQAAQSRSPQLRANAIEAMHSAPQFIEPLVRRGLVDENRGVRFVAAMTVGRLKLQHLAHLLEPMQQDESRSVQAAALYGLHQNGYTVDLNPIAEFLFSNDPEVKANAALILGELGDPSAVPMLRDALGQGLVRTSTVRARLVDLQIAEAMVKLGEEGEMNAIRAALFSPAEQGELTALAALICGRLKDEKSEPRLFHLATNSGERRQPAEVRMAATLALAQIRPDRAPAAVPIEYVRSDRPELRMQAALTMGAIESPDTQRPVVTMMGDSNPLVQVAAAGAVLEMQQRSIVADQTRWEGTAGSIDTNQSPRYKKELSQVGESRR